MGKFNKSRDCPAVGRKIKGDECGANRGTNYRCPSDCPHCPWTEDNYDQMLEIERKLERKTIDFLAATIGSAEVIRRMGLDPGAEPDDVDVDEDEEELRIQANVYREIFLVEHRPGRKLFDVWREAGWKGLRNDEIFLAGFMAQSRPAVLEVRQVLDELRSECIDLLEERGEPFVICDRGLAANARQYQSFICWLLPGPFFHRLQGIAWPVPLSPASAREDVQREVARLGGPAWGDATFTDWLGRNMTALRDSFAEESGRRFSSLLRTTDIKQCVATYLFDGTAEDLGLTDREDFDELNDNAEEVRKRGPHRAFVWLRAGASKAWESRLPAALQGGIGLPGTPIWGHVRFFPGRVELSAMSGMHFGAMKEMAEEFFGDRLGFEKEFVADLAKQVAAGRGPVDDLQPSAGLSATTSHVTEDADFSAVEREVMDGHYRHFLDNPLPALDGVTPREAAKRPEMRERLISLMKGHLQSVDAMGQSKGKPPYDLGWVLEELGLTELVAAPRKPAQHAAGALSAPVKNWWREIRADEVARLLEKTQPYESHASDPLDSMPELLDYISDMDGVFKHKDEQIALSALTRLVLNLVVPVGIHLEPVTYDAMQTESNQVWRRLKQLEEAGDLLPNLLDESPQPEVLKMAGLFLAQAAAGPPGESGKHAFKIEPENVLLILIELEALLRILRRSALG